MRFIIKLQLSHHSAKLIPINYQYPLSAAIYKILQKGDADYAKFLHTQGYGKGYKLFTFSDLRLKFKHDGDRMKLLEPMMEFTVCFHLPEAAQAFVEGLFRSEEVVLADQLSKAEFKVQSITSLKNPLQGFEDMEIVEILTKPLSMIVAGVKNEKENYNFLSPDDPRFNESLLFNWRNKIEVSYGVEEAKKALLVLEVEKYENPWRSRLVTIKPNTDAETKIKGYLNFKLKLIAEKRFLDLILNSGLGLYTAQGMGCLETV